MLEKYGVSGPFARYLAGEAVSMTGTWMQVMTQSWVMTTLTTSAAMLGLVNFAMGLPMVALTMVGGIVADRYDRRRILFVTQIVQIILAVLVGWLVEQGRIQIWQLVVVSFLLGVSGSFEMPAASALVPELVDKEHIAKAVAFDRAIFHGTRLVGPALAGYVIGWWSTAAAFYLNAFSFMALILALFSLPVRRGGLGDAERRRGNGLKEGLAYVRSDQPTVAMIAIMAAVTVFVFPVMVVMLPLYARQELLLGPDYLGWLMGVSSIGSFTGVLSLLAFPREKRCWLMLGATLAVGIAMATLSQAHSFLAAAVALVFQSLGVSTMIGLANVIVQERAPSPLRGRVSAITGLSFFGLMPFASLGVTAVADAIGMRSALLTAAGLFLGTSLTVLATFRRHLRTETRSDGNACPLAGADGAKSEIRIPSSEIPLTSSCSDTPPAATARPSETKPACR